MYTLQKRIQKPSRTTLDLSGRRCAQRKFEGNSNVTSKRLTVPPGFLAAGVVSEVVKKKNVLTSKYKKTERAILNEDLTGLFYDNKSFESKGKLRRSSRLSKKSLQTPLAASDYLHLLSDKQVTSKPTKKSKSIFKAINERCLKLKPSSQPVAENIFETVAEKFDFNLDSTLYAIGYQIRKEICKVNKILLGESDLLETMDNGNQQEVRNNVEVENEQEFRLVPPQDWVFKTPPKQRISLPKVEGCAIEPAVLCTTKKRQNIYQVKRGIDIDLTKFVPNQKIKVDERVLTLSATFENSEEFRRNNEEYMDLDDGQDEDLVSNYSMLMTMRPKKKMQFSCKKSALKCKDLFKIQQEKPSCSSSMEVEPGFAFLNEPKNDFSLFKSQEKQAFMFSEHNKASHKMFDFRMETESPKMFNFNNKADF